MCLVVASCYLRHLQGCLAYSNILMFSSLRTSLTETLSTYYTSCSFKAALPVVFSGCVPITQSLLQVFAPQDPAPSAPAPRFPDLDPQASTAASQPWGAACSGHFSERSHLRRGLGDW